VNVIQSTFEVHVEPLPLVLLTGTVNPQLAASFHLTALRLLWFPPPRKIVHHDITEMLLKVALNTINPNPN
jgi:hypothetical protein